MPIKYGGESNHLEMMQRARELWHQLQMQRSQQTADSIARTGQSYANAGAHFGQGLTDMGNGLARGIETAARMKFAQQQADADRQGRLNEWSVRTTGQDWNQFQSGLQSSGMTPGEYIGQFKRDIEGPSLDQEMMNAAIISQSSQGFLPSLPPAMRGEWDQLDKLEIEALTSDRFRDSERGYMLNQINQRRGTIAQFGQRFAAQNDPVNDLSQSVISADQIPQLKGSGLRGSFIKQKNGWHYQPPDKEQTPTQAPTLDTAKARTWVDENTGATFTFNEKGIPVKLADRPKPETAKTQKPDDPVRSTFGADIGRLQSDYQKYVKDNTGEESGEFTGLSFEDWMLKRRDDAKYASALSTGATPEMADVMTGRKDDPESIKAATYQRYGLPAPKAAASVAANVDGAYELVRTMNSDLTSMGKSVEELPEDQKWRYYWAVDVLREALNAEQR